MCVFCANIHMRLLCVFTADVSVHCNCWCVHVCALCCVTEFQATGMRDYLDFPSGIFSGDAEKYH